MNENRFFQKSGPYKLIELSNLIEGILNSSDNSDILIEDISPLHTAKSSDITFFSKTADSEIDDVELSFNPDK